MLKSPLSTPKNVKKSALVHFLPWDFKPKKCHLNFEYPTDFVGGLGPGQVAGRQALGAGSLGELQISLQVSTYYYVTELGITSYF